MSSKSDAVTERIETEVTAPLAGLSLDVEAVELTPAGKRRVLRIAVDKDGGVTLDDVAEATRVVEEVLDASDVMGEHPYTLEVTSRGADRPLTLPRHWRRNVDRLVAVSLVEGGEFTGRILSADDTTAQVRIEADRKNPAVEREVTFADVARAVVQIEFNRRSATDDSPADDTDEVAEHPHDNEKDA